MKKILGISLVAVLMAMPMMANAAVTDAAPVAGNADSPTATDTPKYDLKGAGANDGNAATAGYVKGAYNALIKGINATQEEIDDLNSDIDTYQNAIDHLLDGKATQDGTVATIKDATTAERIHSSTVNISGVTTSSISAKASGNVNLTMPIMNDWSNDSAGTPIQTTTTFTNLDVANLAMSAPGTNNTATLTKNDITGGTVDVVKYLAKAGFDFTTLINVEGDDYAYKSAIYPNGDNSTNTTGLSNGEWTATWNSYGTVKGTSMCSSTSGTYGQTGSPSSTEGEYCWCKMTRWTPNGGNETPAASLWVFNDTMDSASDCAIYCAGLCGNRVRDDSSMRSGLFGSVQ